MSQPNPFIEESKKKNDLTAVTMIALDDIARFTRESRNAMREMNNTLKSWNARGKAVPVHILLTGGAPAVQIDFESGNATNIDPASLNLPQTKLFGLIIYNYGPGRVMWSTNENKGVLTAENEIDPEADGKMSTFNASVSRLNLVAPDGDARVKVTAII